MPSDETDKQRLPWPAVGYETLPWEADFSNSVASRREFSRHRGPYRASVVPEIAGRDLVLPSEVTALADDAYRKRNRAWRTVEVLTALDAFAARAGRRVPGH